MKINYHVGSHGIAQAGLKLAFLLLAGITVLPHSTWLKWTILVFLLVCLPWVDRFPLQFYLCKYKKKSLSLCEPLLLVVPDFSSAPDCLRSVMWVLTLAAGQTKPTLSFTLPWGCPFLGSALRHYYRCYNQYSFMFNHVSFYCFLLPLKVTVFIFPACLMSLSPPGTNFRHYLSTV